MLYRLYRKFISRIQVFCFSFRSCFLFMKILIPSNLPLVLPRDPHLQKQERPRHFALGSTRLANPERKIFGELAGFISRRGTCCRILPHVDQACTPISSRMY